MQVNKIVTMEYPVSINIKGATLLTVKEASALSVEMRKCFSSWWLRSPGRSGTYAACVGGGSVKDDIVEGSLGVRPALEIEDHYLDDGDQFNFAHHRWTVIKETKALCNDTIGICAFRENWQADNANNYEQSDIKKYVDEWFAKVMEVEDASMGK